MLIFKGNFDVESDFRMDRILIIDDDEELCELVSEYLEVEGVILERAAKAQRFSDYLLRRAAEERADAHVTA